MDDKGIPLNHGIPQEIIRDIFSRLPVKSLTRFRSLSKWWFNHLKTREFIGDHLHRSTQINNSLLLHRFEESELYSLRSEISELEAVHIPTNNNFTFGLEIVGSCNGVLCVSHSYPLFSSDCISLWNPATKEVKILPPTAKGAIAGMELSTFAIGFGFNSDTDDYNIVTINVFMSNIYSDSEDAFYDAENVGEEVPDRLVQVQVYSLNSQSWKEIKDVGDVSLPPDFFDIEEHYLTANGALFWMTNGHCDFILSFVMANEVLQRIALPDSVTSSDKKKLAMYKESVAMLVMKHKETEGLGYSVELWMMMKGINNGDDCWSMLFEVNVCTEPFVIEELPVGFWKDELVIQAKEASNDSDEAALFLFNPNSIERKKLPTHGSEFSYIDFNYAESLVPLGDSEVEEAS
ncbi:putative F-box family protein [Quillaja saponaria]|uniref:F-box family protein n=1 Tax=Quillaja saponaria TaxID=32244 RepID=A0AAD7LL35_QUISA|nr:putative F-box family protein [Quillaja saponaria]KAJ7959282.1 putative F-box family protein [Quillaja saponaria]